MTAESSIFGAVIFGRLRPLESDELFTRHFAERFEPRQRRLRRVEPERLDDRVAQLFLEIGNRLLLAVGALVHPLLFGSGPVAAAVFEEARHDHGALGEHAQHRRALALHGRLFQRLDRVLGDEPPSEHAVLLLERRDGVVGLPIEGAVHEVALQKAFALQTRLRSAYHERRRAILFVLLEYGLVAGGELRCVELVGRIDALFVRSCFTRRSMATNMLESRRALALSM